MQHHVLDGKDLYHGIFAEPRIKFCTFSDEYGDAAQIVRQLNFGSDMLRAYEQLSYDRSLEGVAKFMRQLDAIYAGYQSDKRPRSI